MFFVRMFTLKLKWKMICYLVLLFSAMITFFWWATLAEKDLLYQTTQPSTELIIYPSENSKGVWNWIFKGEKKVNLTRNKKKGLFGRFDSSTSKQASLFGMVTRLILILVVTLSVTMILYNWIMYIVKVWQWEDSKNLIKNVAYIVVWILISLFSVVIMTLLRSVPQTIEEDIPSDVNNPDREVLTESED